jgi:O-methyltransferase involved in polyketide biosynthesis
MWLGVTPYLARDTVFSLLQMVAGSADAGIAFDYSEPIESYPPERRARVAAMAERVAAAGEPWITLLDPNELHAALQAMGYAYREDLDASAVAARYFTTITGAGSSSGAGPHLVFARTVAALQP